MDLFLRRGLVVASIIIVVVLSAVAIFSLVDDTSTEDANAEVGEEAPASADRVLIGQRVAVADAALPLTVGCLPVSDGEPGPSDAYMIVLENLGGQDVDYKVAATVTDTAGRTKKLVIDVPPLQPGQEVEQFVVPTGGDPDLDRIESCRVTAVETDRRVLLFD